MRIAIAASSLVLTMAAAAQADIITQWNFNSNPADASTSTGLLTPSTGSGTASTVGGTVGSFATGSPSDAAAAGTDNSGWGLTTWAAQGAGSGTRGAQFSVATTGATAISVSFDLRDSGTVSRYFQMQYTTDGTNWLTPSAAVGTASGPTTLNNNVAATFGNDGLIMIQAASGSQQFAQGFSYTFSTAAVENNANFGIRLVAVFAPSTSTYISSNAGTSTAYSTSGTFRIDTVTFNGTIPTPGCGALMGLGMLAASRRRRV